MFTQAVSFAVGLHVGCQVVEAEKEGRRAGSREGCLSAVPSQVGRVLVLSEMTTRFAGAIPFTAIRWPVVFGCSVMPLVAPPLLALCAASKDGKYGDVAQLINTGLKVSKAVGKNLFVHPVSRSVVRGFKEISTLLPTCVVEAQIPKELSPKQAQLARYVAEHASTAFFTAIVVGAVALQFFLEKSFTRGFVCALGYGCLHHYHYIPKGIDTLFKKFLSIVPFMEIIARGNGFVYTAVSLACLYFNRNNALLIQKLTAIITCVASSASNVNQVVESLEKDVRSARSPFCNKKEAVSGEEFVGFFIDANQGAKRIEEACQKLGIHFGETQKMLLSAFMSGFENPNKFLKDFINSLSLGGVFKKKSG